jgi:hypothetical protein
MHATGRAAARAAALLSYSLLAACASDAASDLGGEALPAERIVQERTPGAAARAMAEGATASEAEGALAKAEEELAAGDPGAALETVRRALLRMPPQEQGERLRALRLKAKREFLRTAIARGETTSPAMVAEGEPIAVRVAVRNLSPAPMVSGRSPSGTSPNMVLLRVSRTAWDVFGNVRTESWEETHPLPDGEAGPGGALAAEISVDTSRFRETRPHGFIEYEFGGVILPSALTVGETAVHERIPLEESATRAFPQKGWEEVAADPAAHLDRGIRNGNPVRVLVAAACLPPEERASTAARLARELRDGLPGGGAALESSVRAALRLLGGDREADRWPVETWDARVTAATESIR